MQRKNRAGDEMKNKIKQFSKGEFKLSKPDIVFPETNICISVGEGELYQGSFTIENRKDGDIRGLVYPSSFRVHFTNQGFEGNPVEVKFVYDSTGMRPGQVENGKFVRMALIYTLLEWAKEQPAEGQTPRLDEQLMHNDWRCSNRQCISNWEDVDKLFHQTEDGYRCAYCEARKK